MKLYSENNNYKLYQGNMLDMLEVIEPNTIDSIVTDPPYGLTSITKRFGKENSAECQYGKDGSFQRLSKGFMGKEWDGSGIEYNIDTWKKCYEVLKPGGYLLAFGGSRTFHRIACAIEDAGFEIRDTIMWLYGSGFPKSMNIGLAIDKKNGVDNRTGNIKTDGKATNSGSGCYNCNDGKDNSMKQEYEERIAQNEWNGWGTALKPSFEPIIVARKPFKGSLVDNVIEYGVGGINIDECRVKNINNEKLTRKLYDNPSWKNSSIAGQGSIDDTADRLGRFPANTILTYDETDFEEVCGGFPDTKSGNISKEYKQDARFNIAQSGKGGNLDYSNCYGDSGSASRYFMNCKYTRKDEEIWKQLLVNNVGNNLEILKVTKESIVQINVEDLLKELKDHYAKYVDNQLDLTETSIVQDIVKMLTWDFKIETSQVIQDFILNYKECTQFLNLVQFVEKMDNIDTTQITQNLLKLFGYVKNAITNYIVGNFTVNELDQKRYTYQPKASKKDRDEGLDEFETKQCVGGGGGIGNYLEDVNSASGKFGSEKAPHKNTHPTVKPTELMQYLIRLVSPNGATILDPFNGSGSTGKAVMYENKERNKNYKYIGIELTEEYLPIAKARIEYVCNLRPEENPQMSIFDYEE